MERRIQTSLFSFPSLQHSTTPILYYNIELLHPPFSPPTRAFGGQVAVTPQHRITARPDEHQFGWASQKTSNSAGVNRNFFLFKLILQNIR